jgi:uncharacterized protein YwgA
VTKYQLAKLVHWAGTLETRKRMQKVAYLLQSAGCPLSADFFLHRFGPYSQEVARLTDELVADGVLNEVKTNNGVGYQFGYQLTEQGKTLLSSFESQAMGEAPKLAMATFENLAKQLATSELRKLEIASTIAYYYQIAGDWDAARESACRFKNILPDTDFAKSAEVLAQTVVK